MRTKETRKQEMTEKSNPSENENFFVTLPSTLNYVRESDEDDAGLGYPDFYEDTDNMNRYLW
ncbi:hypothetical protein [Flavobacterium selenitireducens]|uniref:hypothetical protein n=1 Tax=Flavobacterium selenitireducens TaxID=2722704 RepID=UPI00168BAE8F|nr:hypothetical protein [Flavobacterium selenitireducens]MBD3583352.1 hypothetical protein [Flavobacterium selenitireducens]